MDADIFCNLVCMDMMVCNAHAESLMIFKCLFT